MYIIYRNNRRFNKMVFDTYEQARQYVRRWIRNNTSLANEWSFLRSSYRKGYNPPINDFDFTVKRTNAA